MPGDWRRANVAPIFKKGSKSEAGNYRPVSLTSMICKVMESIIKDAVMEHLVFNKLIRSSQHGFMARKSCLTNLLEYLETLTRLVDEGHDLDIIYLDFAKAFDKVPHQRLVAKMMAHGISGKVVKWVEAWLTGREQRVVINGKMSAWAPVDSGVPQGSVLGPTLFIIFINDLDMAIDIISSIISKFADDTKVGRIVENDEGRAALQADLDKLLEWADKWQMQFNASKCKVLHIGKKNQCFSYTMGGHAPAGMVLQRTVEEKDVGVLIQENLKPSAQCAKAAKKANQVLGQMSRGLHFRDRSTWIRLYQQYCRPHLEYCIQAWSPWTKADQELLESVQERAVRMCSGLQGRTYSDRLREVGLTTLVERRRRGDMIQVWKTLHEKVDVNPETWFAPMNSSGAVTRMSGDPWNIAKPVATKSLDIRTKFWSVRSVDAWNNLPFELKSSRTVIAFKSNYDKL